MIRSETAMGGSSDDFTVLMIPDYGDENPYQASLCEALEARDIKVIRSYTTGWFAILSDIRVHGLPDVLHLHWLHPFTFHDRWFMTVLEGVRLLTELVLLRLLGVQIVWTVHNILEHERRQPTLERGIKHLLVWLCDDVIVHCDRARALAIDMYRLPKGLHDKFVVIPHGNYISVYPNEIDPDEARQELALEEEVNPVYLFFGNIKPYKNVPVLVETFSQLEATDARLLIVGSPETSDIKSEVISQCKRDQRVHAVLERVPEDEVQYYMNAADVVVLPFERILTSGSALLAMSFGKAVIAPSIGCMGEILDSAGGYPYNPHDETELKHALEWALTADLDAMGDYNYQKAKRYSWSRIAEKTADTYYNN